MGDLNVNFHFHSLPGVYRLVNSPGKMYPATDETNPGEYKQSNAAGESETGAAVVKLSLIHI